MSIAAPPKPADPRELLSLPPGFRVEPMTTEEYDRRDAAGEFGNAHAELIDGYLIEGRDLNPPHANGIRRGKRLFDRLFPSTHFTVDVQLPVYLPSGDRVMPDFAVHAGELEQITDHPTTALLVVEVSDSSLRFDRQTKGAAYARNGIPEYWVLNVPDRVLEVHRDPVSVGTQEARYADVRAYRPGESVEPLAAPGRPIAVEDLLPPAPAGGG